MKNADELNPQPLPPRSIDLGHLTETVMTAFHNASAQSKGRGILANPRIIVGIIAEPNLNAAEGGGGTTVGNG